VTIQTRLADHQQGFHRAFISIATFLGRPSAENVLFSGVPISGRVPTEEELEHLSGRIGLVAQTFGAGDFRRNKIELPFILFFKDRDPIAVLEARPDGSFLTSPLENGATRATREVLLGGQVERVVAFSLVYANSSEDALVGHAVQIDRKHWLTGTMSGFWWTYSYVVVAAIFINVIALISPIFTMNVYDRILPNHAMATLWVLAIGVATALVFDMLLKTARALLIDHAGRQADLKISYLLFEKVLNSSLSARPESTGEYANRVTQYEFVREFFTSNTISVLIDTAFVFLFIAVIYSLAGWIAFIPGVAFIAALAIGLIAQYRIGRWVAAAMNESSLRQSLLVESISTIETVKALKAETYLLRRWRELSKNAAFTSERIKQVSANAANVTQFIQQLVSVAIIVAGAYAFSAGDISTGAIIASVMLSGRAVGPLSQITLTLARFRQAMLSLRIINKIMEQPEDNPATTGFVNRSIRTGAIEFRAVDFNYPNTDNLVLKGLSFVIKPGERVGIIGRIGSGKTTIGRLLARLYLPVAGEILVDGIDIRQYHPAELRAAVASAGQNADLFSGTIKENLLMVRPEASDAEILAACRMSGVDEFVSRHPRGYDMNVGERGNNLSGGQKQAVAIARLLLARPKIVFLDEPSGSMDLASERMLIKQLSAAFDRDTSLVISTHRFSMLELVDRLIVIDQGRVIADGPKAQVLAAMQKGMSA